MCSKLNLQGLRYVQRENILICQTYREMQTAQRRLYCVTLTQMMLLSAQKQTRPYRDSEYVNSRNHTVTASFPAVCLVFPCSLFTVAILWALAGQGLGLVTQQNLFAQFHSYLLFVVLEVLCPVL